ncbi:MAG TPA: hypothetical protein VFJ58_06955 [Armatimonadota bacterium]|nr:hypothetical protein [Armatimonadota bacterium]
MSQANVLAGREVLKGRPIIAKGFSFPLSHPPALYIVRISSLKPIII